MGSGGGGGSGGTNVQRYAPYVETKHSDFLTEIAKQRIAVQDESPYDDFTSIDVDGGLLGSGYAIASFPSLYDMFGKFMAGLDIDILWTQIYDDTIDSVVVSNAVSAEAALLDDDIEANALPRFQLGMRDINAVNTSSFIIGKALIEEAKVKMLSKFSTELKYRLIPLAQDRWKSHLSWNSDLVRLYAELMKLYYSAKMDVDEFNYAIAAKNSLWPFTVLDYERAALGALQGAISTQTAGSSTAQKAISGALSGAATGAMVGASLTTPAPFLGAGIGAALGLAAGLL